MVRLPPALLSPSARRLYLLLLLLLAAGLGVNMVRRTERGSSAFDDSVRFSRELVYEGVDVYRVHPAQATHTKYPPFFFLFVAPFVGDGEGGLTRPGAALWYLLNLLLALGAVALAVRAVAGEGRPPPPRAYLLVGGLVAWVFVCNLSRGQVNLVIAFLVCLGFFLFTRKRDLASGLALGVAAALKLTPALLVAFLVYKRTLRPLVGALLALVGCWALLPVLVLGWDLALESARHWLEVLVPYAREGVLGEGVAGVRQTNQSLAAACYRFLTERPADGEGGRLYVNVAAMGDAAAKRLVQGLSVLLLLGAAWIVRGRVQDRRSSRLAGEASLVVVLTVILSPIAWINHYALLVLPYAALVQALGARPPRARDRRLLASALGASFLLVTTSVWPFLMAFSLPLLGALVLAGALADRIRRARFETAPPTGPG